MSEELRECPFCGGSANVDQFESAGGNGRMIWIVGCENPDCEVTFQGHARKVDAKKAWNTRNDRTAIDGFLARVRERYDYLLVNSTSVFNLSDLYKRATDEVHAEMFPEAQDRSTNA